MREGELTAAPVAVFTKLDGYMPLNPCGRSGGPSPGLPFVSAKVPSGVNAEKANCCPGLAGLRMVGVGEATVRFTASLDVGLLRSGPIAAESTLPFALTEWQTTHPLRTTSALDPGRTRRMPPPVLVAGSFGKSGDLYVL